MRIEVDDLSRPQVHALLNEHLTNMYELSPPEQVFALDLDRLRAPDITFFTAWDDDGQLLGCGALKALSANGGEIKSMRTPQALRRRGAGQALLDHILAEARSRHYSSLHLETGTHPDFGASHRLYENRGFKVCGPFADYMENEHSLFMQLQL